MTSDDDPKPEEAGVRAIVERLRSPPENPVTRARRMVEQHVPKNRRGPGWDRHWRELEAYLDTPGGWGKDDGDPAPADAGPDPSHDG